MRWVLLIALCLMLAGCGGESNASKGQADNHGFGWHYDTVGETQLKLRDADPARYSLAQYESDFIQVQSCMGVSMEKAPLVIQRHSLPLGDDFGPLDYGGTYLDTGLILHYAAPGMDAMDSKHARHEFVHWIRLQQVASEAEHRSHDDWAYRRCAEIEY